jgi:hypothetical protein
VQGFRLKIIPFILFYFRYGYYYEFDLNKKITFIILILIEGGENEKISINVFHTILDGFVMFSICDGRGAFPINW